MKSENLQDAVRELYFYEITGTAGGFMTQLFDLFKKADASNYKRLALGFPFEAEALKLWNESGDYGNDLFRKFGLMND